MIYELLNDDFFAPNRPIDHEHDDYFNYPKTLDYHDDYPEPLLDYVYTTTVWNCIQKTAEKSHNNRYNENILFEVLACLCLANITVIDNDNNKDIDFHVYDNHIHYTNITPEPQRFIIYRSYMCYSVDLLRKNQKGNEVNVSQLIEQIVMSYDNDSKLLKFIRDNNKRNGWEYTHFNYGTLKVYALSFLHTERIFDE